MKKDMATDKIIDKCKKLLAMAKDACNENESATAMRQLQKILAKHNLSLGEVESKEEEIDKENWTYSSSGLWSRRILMAISELYFCRMVFFRDKKKQVETYIVIGSELNRIVAMEMGQNAIKLINKLANKGAKDKGNGKIDYKYRVSFRNGAAHRIIQRCDELIKEAKEGKLVGEDGNTLPVLASVYERELSIVDNFIMSTMSTTQKKTRARSSDRDGFYDGDGADAANKVKLRNDQLGKQQKLLE